LPRESSRFPGKSENLRCIHLDLSPFCKIDAHIPLRLSQMALPETHFARIRSIEPLVVTPGHSRIAQRIAEPRLASAK
jgi:hypothetical protein